MAMAKKEKRESGPDKSVVRGAEAALQPGETRFHELFKHMGSGVAIYEAVDDSADFVFLDLNPAAEKIERVLREDILGRRVTEVFPGVKELGVFEVFQRVWRTGTPEHFSAHLYRDAEDAESWREYWVCKLPAGEIVAVYNDITERVRAEEILREGEEQRKAFMENAPDGVYLTDLAGVFLYGNRRAEEITGFRREEIIGKSMMELDLLSPDGLSKAAGLLQASSRGESTGSDELTLKRKDGSAVVVEITTSIVRRHGQQVVMGFVRDITDRKRADTLLQESRAKYEAIFEATGTATLLVEEDTTIITANSECLSATGYSPEELVGTKWPKYVAPESLEIMLEYHNLRREGPGHAPRKYEVKLVNKNGQIRDVILDIAVIRGTKRSVVSILDITELKRTEEALRRSEENFRRSMEESPLGVRVVNAEGETIFTNQALLDIYGFDSLEELKMTPVEKRYTAESYIEYKKRHGEKSQQDKDSPSEYEISIVRKNGEVRHLLVSGKWQL